MEIVTCGINYSQHMWEIFLHKNKPGVLLHSTFVSSKSFHTHEIEHLLPAPGSRRNRPHLCFPRALGLGLGSRWPAGCMVSAGTWGAVSVWAPPPRLAAPCPWLWLGSLEPWRQLGQGLGQQVGPGWDRLPLWLGKFDGLGQWFSPGSNFASRGQVTMSRTILGCRSWVVTGI